MLVLKSLGILAENKEDLQMLIGHGLTAKVMSKFVRINRVRCHASHYLHVVVCLLGIDVV